MKNAWPLQRDCMKFYGDPRKAGWLAANTTRITCPWQMRVGKVPVKQLMVHKKCAESMLRVFKAIWEAVGKDQAKINKLHYNIFDGIYNLRTMRGSNQMSMHSFAIAIDIDAAHNGVEIQTILLGKLLPILHKLMKPTSSTPVCSKFGDL